MKPSRLLASLLVLVLAVLAVGMAFSPAVVSDGGDAGTYVEGPVAVEGGEIDADQTTLWGWTQRAMDRDVNATPTVVIRDFGNSTAGATAGAESTAFQRLLVYDDPDRRPPGGVLAFVTAFSTDVNVNEARLPSVRNGTTGRTVEGLLVHEFAHVVQFQTPAFATNQLNALAATADETTAYRAMVEGGAEFVADEYTNDSAVERVRTYWNDPSTSAAARLGQWPYYRGLVYLDQRLEQPSDLWDVYRDRPRTTATILRGDAPDDGPPNRSIAVDVDDHHTEVRDRPGAVLAEVALTREIAPGRARDVAAGWRWGALRSIEPDRGTASDRSLRHVWVTEWRNETAADDFEAAMRAYLDGRWERENGTWDASDGPSFELERVDDDSLALLAGPDAFLANVSVAATLDGYAVASTTNATTVSNASAAASADASRSAPGGDAARAGARARDSLQTRSKRLP